MPLFGRRCPECAATLAIHQPDTRRPDRLLGACLECGTWCLLDDSLALVAILPRHERRRRRGRRPPGDRPERPAPFDA